MWLTLQQWLNRYVWQFKIGKAGTALVALGAALDLYHKAETLYQWFTEIPTVVEVLQSGLFHLTIIVFGMVLMYASTRKGRNSPPPATPEQRLDDWDTRFETLATMEALNRVVDLYEQRNDVNDEVHRDFKGQFIGLQKDRTKAIAERTNTDGRVNSMNQRLNASEDAFSALPRFISSWVSFSDLVREAGESTDMFLRLRNMYGSAAPFTARPFSGWRPTNQTLEGVPTSVLEAEKWARSLEDHIQHVERFYATYRSEARSPLFDTVLFELIRNWVVVASDISGDRLLELLQEHRIRLIDLRRSHAASVAAGALAKVTMP